MCQRRRRGKSTDKDRIKEKEWEKESEKRENLDGEGRSHGVAVRWRGLIERVFPRHTREKFFRQDKLLSSPSVFFAGNLVGRGNFRERFTKDFFPLDVEI